MFDFWSLEGHYEVSQGYFKSSPSEADFLISRFQLLNVDKRNPRKKSTRSFYPERGRGHTVHKVHTVLCRRLGKQIDLTPKGQKIF